MNTWKKTALVTGGSRGIGVGIVCSLLKAGYQVAIGYRQTENQAKQLAANNSNALPVYIDIQSADSVHQAFKTLKAQLGDVNVLVNNAAIAQEKPFMEISDADWMAMLDINLLGAVRCIREVIPAMQQQRFGRIINISSIGGQWGGINQIHYAAAKAALINLTRSMAKVYSKDGITCNAIAPGLIATDMSAAELTTPLGQEKVKNIPAGRLGTIEEVGTTVVYLAAEEAGYVTGQTLNLNGGMYFV